MDAVKAQLKQLMAQRDGLEKEIADRSARLDAAGVGMHGKLVDAEGFPRADIDIPAIRNDRSRVIALTNDHKALSRQMETLLHQLHSMAREGVAATAAAPPPAALATPAPAAAAPQPAATAPAAPAQPQLRPFALIDEVSAGSPASAAGLEVGDQLLRLGGVDAGGGMAALPALLQGSEGQALQALVLRRGEQLALTLVPSRWQGRGLLGCHLQVV